MLIVTSQVNFISPDSIKLNLSHCTHTKQHLHIIQLLQVSIFGVNNFSHFSWWILFYFMVWTLRLLPYSGSLFNQLPMTDAWSMSSTLTEQKPVHRRTHLQDHKLLYDWPTDWLSLCLWLSLWGPFCWDK